MELESGRTIAQFSSDSSLQIVFLAAASECLSCSNDLHRWVEIARENFGQTTLVLTSQPPVEIRDALLRLRLPYAVVSQRDERIALDLAPAIFVFRNGQALLIESRIAPDQRAFLVDSVRQVLAEGRD